MATSKREYRRGVHLEGEKFDEKDKLYETKSRITTEKNERGKKFNRMDAFWSYVPLFPARVSSSFVQSTPKYKK